MWKQRPARNTHINVQKKIFHRSERYNVEPFFTMFLSPGPLLHLHQVRPTFHYFVLLWIDQLDIFWQWHLKFTVIEIVTKLCGIGCVHVEFDVNISEPMWRRSPDLGCTIWGERFVNISFISREFVQNSYAMFFFV